MIANCEPTVEEAVQIILWNALRADTPSYDTCMLSKLYKVKKQALAEGKRRNLWLTYRDEVTLNFQPAERAAMREILEMFSDTSTVIPVTDSRLDKVRERDSAARLAMRTLIGHGLLTADNGTIRCGIKWWTDTDATPAPAKSPAPLPEPEPAPPPAPKVSETAAVHGGSPDAPCGAPPRKPQGTAQPTPKPPTPLPAPPTKPAAFEVLLDVQRRVKRVEDFFSPTTVDPTGADVLLQSAHPDTVNCLRRVCVLLQVYGSQQRYQLTNGRVSSKHKSRLPEAISLGLRLGVIGLSTADGKSLTLGDHAVVMPDAELERRAAEQRVRDVKNKPRTIREVMGV